MAYLPTRQQIGDSCILISSCIILSHLTSTSIEYLANHFNQKMIAKYNYDRNFFDNDPFITYNNIYKSDYRFTGDSPREAFADLCKHYNISYKPIDTKLDLLEIEKSLKDGNSYSTISFKRDNGQWHVTAVGCENQIFYTSETNTNQIIQIGNSILDLSNNPFMTQIYGPIIDIGGGILFTKNN